MNINDKTEFNLSRLPESMEALHAERQRLGLSAIDLELRSGVTTSALYAYRNRKINNPGLANVVALAEALGFEIVMRRKDAEK